MVMNRIGEKESPWEIAPSDWHEEGIPYGDWFRCDECDLVARSTVMFDCYAHEVGDPLVCGGCRGIDMSIPALTNAIAEKILSDEKNDNG